MDRSCGRPPSRGPPVCSGTWSGTPKPTAEEQAASAEPLRRSMYRHEAHPEPVVLVPVLQLFKADAPQLDYPDGADLLQIVWCPNIHENSVPWVRVFWRRAADVRDPLAEMPAPNRKEGDRYAPRACVVHPELVPEFPPICCLSNPRERYESLGKMPYDLEERVRAWSDRQPESGEYYGLAHAPGWKVGGWDISSPEGEALRGCPCGTDMQPLLTTDYDEDLDGWPPQQDPEFAWGDHRKWQDREPTGVNVTRSGIFVILQCPADPTHPLEHLIVY